jgi:PAS domain-containing protein
MSAGGAVEPGGLVVETLSTGRDDQRGWSLEGFDPGRIQSIVDVVADGITVQGPDGRLVYANEAAARACGFESAAALVRAGRSEILARFELYDEDGEPLDPALLPGASVLRGEPATDRVVGFRILSTGETRWSTVSAVPLRDAAGNVEFAVNAFHDITGRKHAEDERDRERARLAATLSQRLADEARLAELIRSERARSAELNAIIGAIGEGIIVVDRDGQITLANRTARRLLGPFDEVSLHAVLARFDRSADMAPTRSRAPARAPAARSS